MSGATDLGGDDGSTGPAVDGGADGSVELAWSVVPPPTFVSGSGGIYDLSATLPAGIAKGGTFAVDPSGAALPPGMSLAPNGQLSLGTAAVGVVTGVVFSYDSP